VRRWYAGDPYEDAVIAALPLERRMAAPLSLGLEVSAAARDNIQREDYDGTHYRAVGRMRLSLSGAAFLSVSVSFLNQSMTATFADVDFVSRVGDMTETAGGVDFGLSVNATISGDDLLGVCTCITGAGP
jgi:hypothetical protein